MFDERGKVTWDQVLQSSRKSIGFSRRQFAVITGLTGTVGRSAAGFAINGDFRTLLSNPHFNQKPDLIVQDRPTNLGTMDLSFYGNGNGIEVAQLKPDLVDDLKQRQPRDVGFNYPNISDSYRDEVTDVASLTSVIYDPKEEIFQLYMAVGSLMYAKRAFWTRVLNEQETRKISTSILTWTPDPRETQFNGFDRDGNSLRYFYGDKIIFPDFT